jgi:antitoxin (DNA-binding transcriptional repressor) of toxin-antitoxin stability system
LRAGKTVELRDRDKVIGRIVPLEAASRPRENPDFRAIRREIFGDRLLPGADLLIEEREKSRY